MLGVVASGLALLLGVVLARALRAIANWLAINRALKRMPHLGRGILGWPEFAAQPDRFPMLLASKANELGGGCTECKAVEPVKGQR